LAQNEGEFINTMPQLFTSRGESQYPLKRRMGRPQSQSGRYKEEKNLLLLLGFEPWIVQPIIQSLY